MNSYRARRATTDDLDQLLDLWAAAQFPVIEMEKQFTDFQVVEDGQGKILGAIGLQVLEKEGRLFGETYLDFGLTDTLRPLLWERLELILKNHGLVRIWTRETAPFWKKNAGFVEPPADVLAKLPALFGPSQSGWLHLKLREDSASQDAVDKAFAMFREMERAKTEQAIQRAKNVKVIFTFLAALLFIAVLLLGVYVFLHLPARHR